MLVPALASRCRRCARSRNLSTSVAGIHIEDQLYPKRALTELKEKGEYNGLSQGDCVTAQHDIETLIGLDQFYEVEEESVEEKRWGRRYLFRCHTGEACPWQGTGGRYPRQIWLPACAGTTSPLCPPN